MTGIRIRFGYPAERSVLEEMQRRASLEWEEYREALLAHPEAIQLPLTQLEERRVRVAEIAHEPVGFSVLLPQAAGTLELDGLFVEPARWRMGIGRALMSDAVDQARLNNARAIEVTANPRAEGFYAKVGFIQLSSAKTQFGPAIRMRCVVTDGFKLTHYRRGGLLDRWVRIALGRGLVTPQSLRPWIH